MLGIGDEALRDRLVAFAADLRRTAQEKGKAVRGENAHRLGF
jgi:hypothetical protein